MQQFKMKAIKTGLENRNILFSNIQNHESNKQLSENWETIRKSLFELVIIAMFTTLAFGQNLTQRKLSTKLK